jgi:metallo-beta-lactamase family protein
MVRDGYRGPIYMTKMTQILLPSFLMDSASQQEENAEELRRRFPQDAFKFETLYDESDVGRTVELCVGVDYRKTIEILPGVKVTFFENGHILGAACILVQFDCYGKKTTNYLFTGDYRAKNPLFFVPVLPKWVRNLELNIVCESTYGATESKKIRKCFERNIMEAFEKRQNILIGAFAQGRMQEILNRFRIMQEEGKIPPEYEICIDGGLGVGTCWKYLAILQQYYPNAPDFMPDNVRILDAKTRATILDECRASRGHGLRKIVITTSGMLSNGPARVHVPNFIERFDCMIHLCGYAAEETIARHLLDTIKQDEVIIRDSVYQKNAIVRTTREFTSHAPADELLKFLRQFKNVRFVAVNHGATEESKEFVERIIAECPNIEEVGRIDRHTMFCFVQKARRGADYCDIDVKARPAKFRGPYNMDRMAKAANFKHRTKKTSRDGRERRR